MPKGKGYGGKSRAARGAEGAPTVKHGGNKAIHDGKTSSGPSGPSSPSGPTEGGTGGGKGYGSGKKKK